MTRTVSILLALLLLAAPAASALEGSAEGEPAAIPAEPPAPGPPEEGSAYAVHGTLDSFLRWRQTVRDQDWDAAGTVWLQAGDPLHHSITASLSALGRADLDGNRDTYGIYSLDSPQDAYDAPATGQLLEATLDLNRILLLDRIRLGRQESLGVESARFDGIRAETMDLLPSRAARFTAAFFGGVPVHFWEPSPRGDALFGSVLDLRVRRFLSLGLEGMWVRDRAELWGARDVTRNTVLTVRGSWFPHPDASFRGHVSFRNVGASDLQLAPSTVSLGGTWSAPSLALRAVADLTARLASWEDAAAEFNAFDPVTGNSEGFTRARAALTRSLGRDTDLEAGATVYDTRARSAAHDRDLVSAHAAVRNRDGLAKNLELAAVAESWNPAGFASRFGARVEGIYRTPAPKKSGRKKIWEARLGAGILPYAYERNAERIRETVVFLRAGVKWWPAKGLYAALDFRFEKDRVDVTTGVDLRVGTRF